MLNPLLRIESEDGDFNTNTVSDESFLRQRYRSIAYLLAMPRENGS